MPINNIPGVGPTNADIATAVAAPSSSTIATAVAAAVPTLSQINTSVATNAPSPNGWTVISSITPNNTTSTYTWSSLSGYKSYRVVFAYTTGGLSPIGIRINGDSGSNYNYSYSGQIAVTPTIGYGFNDTKFSIATDFDLSYTTGDVIIDNATVGAFKTFRGNASGKNSGSTAVYPNINGQWRSTSSINSITFFNVGGLNFSAGNITLLGAN